MQIGHSARMYSFRKPSAFTSESFRHSGHGICTAIIPQPVGQQRRIGSRTEIHWVPQLTPRQSVSLLEPWVQPCVTHSKTQMCELKLWARPPRFQREPTTRIRCWERARVRSSSDFGGGAHPAHVLSILVRDVGFCQFKFIRH